MRSFARTKKIEKFKFGEKKDDKRYMKGREKKIKKKVRKKFNIVCAWCGRICGTSEVPNSHGICPECAEAWRVEAMGAKN